MANLKFLRYKTTSEFNTAKTNKTFKQGDVVFDSEAKILYIVTDNTPTLEPYYGNNAIKDVSCNNSEITATLSDGSTKKITVNNVVNAANANKAASADKATGDGDGNAISTTYVKKLSGTTLAAYHIGSLYGQLGVKINLPLTWDPHQAGMFAFTVRLYVGYSYTDIIISGYNYGSNHWYLPKAEIIGGTKGYTVKFGWNTEPKTLFIWIGNENTTTVFYYGGLSIFNVHCGHSAYDMSTGWTSSFCSATELEALSTVGGIQATVVPALNAKADGTNASGTWGINITGIAASAAKLTTNAGSATLPVYFSDGVPKAINTTGVGISITGSAAKIATEVGTSNVNRPVFFAYNGDTTKVVYDNEFKYNPSSNTLTIGTGTLTGTNYSGKAATATSADTANKTQFALKFGENSFDGSSAKTITAADLGLSSALKFLGTTTTVLTDGATTNPITINGANVTAQIGNVVLYNHLEFIWNGSKWEELGDEQSFALKSVQINAGNGLTGGGTLEATRTLSHYTPSTVATNLTASGRRYITGLTFDNFGHVTGYSTGTESDQTTVSSVPWTGITGKPTTLSGYGITDGVPTYTVSAAQTDLTWIKGIAAKKSNRMSFYYNSNGAEWSYLLGCRNTDADDSLSYGSILKFGYTDKYLRILRISAKNWQSTDWEKISAGYADTSGACSGNSATATSATTSKAITINTDEFSNTADSCMPTGRDTFAVYRTGANSGATGADGNIIAMTWANDEGMYGSQIYVDCDPTGYMAFRQRDGSGTWTVWRNIIHSGNIASQSVTYATSAGTATSCSGNSATTTKLATAVNINGTSFNGASNITTANWGTARNITITDGTNTGAAVSVNGSAAVSLKLPTTINANFKGGTISGTTGTFSSSLSVTGDIAASSNVNVTNQTKSKTFSINGGCTLEYDSTNKCVKFVF